MAGSHYNRAWVIHSVMSEALERLLLARFMGEYQPHVPDTLKHLSADPETGININTQTCSYLESKYEVFRNSIRCDRLGKTPRYWSMYLDLIRAQHHMHLAAQENNFQVRMSSWQYFIPFFFVLNKTNYARYRSYYVEILDNLEILYPGLKSLLSSKGMSVQAQDRQCKRTAIDQRGEQTINKDAKTCHQIIGS